MLRPTLLLPLLILVPACDAATTPSPAVVPNLTDGKADVADRVEPAAVLQFEAAVTGAFDEDLQFFGHPLQVRAGAEVRLDVTHAGTASKLDTTMFVYGPRTEAGGYGTEAIAFDDDAGWGRHSRLEMVFDQAGEYLVVLGTHDGQGRGRYRLLATCDDDACEPEAAPIAECHPWVRGRILACFDGQYADAASDPEVGTPSPDEVVAVCTDGEALGPIFDETCGFPNAPDYCEGDFETFAQTVGQACAQALAPYAVECVFGSTYRELFVSPDLAVSPIRVLTPASTLDATAQAQVIAAVRSASFSEVTTLAEAFDAADGHEINQILVWDETSATPYVVYEFGAGDTSVGAYFRAGSDVPVAVNGDGDLEFCSAAKGVMNTACASDDDCAAGTCTGVSPDSGVGRCLDISAPGGGQSCSAEDPCDLEAGLMCAGLSRAEVGMCLPAWMRGNFPLPVPVLEIPDAGSVELPIAVDGLATVDMDVEVDMVVRHPDPTQLRITLVNPDGNALVVFDGTGGEPYYMRIRGSVSGFSGDESVNGTWTLRAVDEGAGDEGIIEEASLRIGSRWD